MANHTDDCPHCGRDRRGHGDHCCPTNAAAVHARATAFRAEQSRRQALFDGFGIGYYYDGNGACVARTPSVVDFLDKLAEYTPALFELGDRLDALKALTTTPVSSESSAPPSSLSGLRSPVSGLLS